MNAILRYELGIKEPDKLTQQEYYQAYAEYLFLTKNKREFLINILRQAILEAFGSEE